MEFKSAPNKISPQAASILGFGWVSPYLTGQ
jgi:hypothetical protein